MKNATVLHGLNGLYTSLVTLNYWATMRFLYLIYCCFLVQKTKFLKIEVFKFQFLANSVINGTIEAFDSLIPSFNMYVIWNRNLRDVTDLTVR